jgi:hypothetical protein
MGAVTVAGGTGDTVGMTGPNTNRLTDPDFDGVASAITVALYAIAYDSARTVIAGASGAIYHSTDDDTFTAATAAGGFAGTFYGASYGASTFVAVGTSGTIQHDADGTGTWTAATAAASFAGTFYDVTWSPTFSRFIACGSGGTVQWDADGAGTWTAGTVSNSYVGNFTRVVEFGGKVYVMGDDGEVQVSSDGASFTRINFGTTAGLDMCVMGPMLAILDNTGSTSRSLWVTGDGGSWAEVVLPTPLVAGYEYRRMGHDRQGHWLFATEDYDRIMFTRGML